ncbi:MAG: hypothetical protein KDA87_03275 [Planctomycetales bacterium]|nr:hypothetical protein [Planctomycetales bacterium]
MNVFSMLMRSRVLLLSAALSNLLMVTDGDGAIPLTGQTGDDIVTLVYDPAGQWWFEHPVNEAAQLETFELGFALTREEQWERLQSLEEPNVTNAPLVTTLEVISTVDLFTDYPIWCQALLCELITPMKRFHLDPSGFGSLPAHGAVPGLDGELVSQMLSVAGSWLGGGAMEPVDLRVIQYGDVTKDGLLDEFDIDALTDAVLYDGPSVPLGYDLNSDGVNDVADRQIWVEEAKKTYFGDANLDGEFNSGDFIAVFRTGEYEDAIAGNSSWSEGDWNGDGEFDSSDFVAAFEGGGYEIGPRPMSPLGDFDRDGMLDIDDINLLLRHVSVGTSDALDVNDDGFVNAGDIEHWVADLKNTWIGDENLDGEFNSSDLVLVFQAGKYEQDVEAVWHEEDWNGDLRFDTKDFVAAFSYQGEPPPRPRMTPVPEPGADALIVLALLCLCEWRFSIRNVSNSTNEAEKWS